MAGTPKNESKKKRQARTAKGREIRMGAVKMRYKKILDKLPETRGNVGKAIIAAGYSPVTAKTPNQITDSKSWKELVAEMLPDSLLAEKHQALLNKKDLLTKQIDVQAVKAGLDMAYKIKGRYVETLNINAEVKEIKGFTISRINKEDVKPIELPTDEV